MNQGIMALANAGRGEDTRLAHLMEGEVVLPPHFLNNNKTLKNNLERNLAKTGTQLSEITVGSNTSSINPYTGLEEFGFFSKLWKKVKKVIDPVAEVARFIPGPWQAPANIYVKGKAAIKIAKGEGGIGDLATIFTGPKVFGSADAPGSFDIFKSNVKAGTPFKFGEYSGAIKEGVGSLMSDPLGSLKEFGSQVTASLPFGTPADQPVEGDIQPTGQTDAQGNPTFMDKLGNIFNSAGQIISGLRSGIQGATGIDPAIAAMAAAYGKATKRALEKEAGGMGDIRQSLRQDLQYTPYGLGGFNLGFAEGGEVMDMRDGGESVGPGTGTSDDIPAMLSDGEFVMTAKANRGAGSVGLREGQGGIMELVPNLEPDRQRGADNMMKLMRYFEGLA
jgi:hypothetical protein